MLRSLCQLPCHVRLISIWMEPLACMHKGQLDSRDGAALCLMCMLNASRDLSKRCLFINYYSFSSWTLEVPHSSVLPGLQSHYMWFMSLQPVPYHWYQVDLFDYPIEELSQFILKMHVSCVRKILLLRIRVGALETFFRHLCGRIPLRRIMMRYDWCPTSL